MYRDDTMTVPSTYSVRIEITKGDKRAAFLDTVADRFRRGVDSEDKARDDLIAAIDEIMDVWSHKKKGVLGEAVRKAWDLAQAMKRFNERPSPEVMRLTPPTSSTPSRPSPPVNSRRIQAVQILRQLYRNQPEIRDAILKDLSLSEQDLVETMEYLMQESFNADELVHCDACDQYHRPEFHGDCRNNDERFPGW